MKYLDIPIKLGLAVMILLFLAVLPVFAQAGAVLQGFGPGGVYQKSVTWELKRSSVDSTTPTLHPTDCWKVIPVSPWTTLYPDTLRGDTVYALTSFTIMAQGITIDGDTTTIRRQPNTVVQGYLTTLKEKPAGAASTQAPAGGRLAASLQFQTDSLTIVTVDDSDAVDQFVNVFSKKQSCPLYLLLKPTAIWIANQGTQTQYIEATITGVRKDQGSPTKPSNVE